MELDLTKNAEYLMRQVTCSECCYKLSVFPIYISSSNGANICGRCKESITQMTSNNIVVIRNTAYESVAKYIQFPCSYEDYGCKASLKHGEVSDHEKYNCPYRIQVCPFSVAFCTSDLQCDWKGRLTFLEDHLSDKHGAAQTNNPHIFTITKSTQVNYVEIDVDIFIIITRYDHNNEFFAATVMCCNTNVEACKEYKYEVPSMGERGTRLKLYTFDVDALVETFEALEQIEKRIIIDAPFANLILRGLNSVQWKILIKKKSSTELDSDNQASNSDYDSKKMASTNFNIGIEGRSSSRILKPPGGGHSDIFGQNRESDAPRQGKITQKSSISECFAYDNGTIDTKQANDITDKVDFKEEKSQDLKNGNGLITNQDENIKHVEEVVVKQQKLRVPPGGFSSGFW